MPLNSITKLGKIQNICYTQKKKKNHSSFIPFSCISHFFFFWFKHDIPRTCKQRMYMQCLEKHRPEKNKNKMKSISAVDSTFCGGRSFCLHHKWIDSNPEQGEDWGQENWPNDDNGRRPVLPPHKTLEERVKMKNHPKGEKELSE